MDVLVVTGGTGGHIYPAIALGEELTREGYSVAFVSRRSRLIKKIFTSSPYALFCIDGRGFKTGFSILGNISFIFRFFLGLYQSFSILILNRPRIVVSMGGYLAPPVILVSAVLCIPVYIFEPNILPGLANRVTSFFARKIMVSFKRTRQFFPEHKSVVCPIPIRSAIERTSRKDGKDYFSLPLDMLCVFIFGGSQGARSINIAMKDALDYLMPLKDHLQFIHVAGKEFFSELQEQYAHKGFSARGITGIFFFSAERTSIFALTTAVVIRYLDHIEYAYAASDLIIARSGASTIAEIIAREVPSLLIQYPYATGQHQKYNALYLEERGASLMIADEILSGEVLAHHLHTLFNQKDKLEQMKHSLKKIKKETYKDNLTLGLFLSKILKCL